jgi:hypothetical protein
MEMKIMMSMKTKMIMKARDMEMKTNMRVRIKIGRRMMIGEAGAEEEVHRAAEAVLPGGGLPAWILKTNGGSLVAVEKQPPEHMAVIFMKRVVREEKGCCRNMVQSFIHVLDGEVAAQDGTKMMITIAEVRVVAVVKEAHQPEELIRRVAEVVRVGVDLHRMAGAVHQVAGAVVQEEEGLERCLARK